MKNLLINIYKFINTLNILLIIYLKKNSKQDPILYVNGCPKTKTDCMIICRSMSL